MLSIIRAFSSTSAAHSGTSTSTPRMIFQLLPFTDTITKFSSFFLPRGSRIFTICSFISPYSFPYFADFRAPEPKPRGASS